MKPALPPPTRPDGTPFSTLDSLFRAVIAVPKTEIDKREEKWRMARNDNKGPKQPNPKDDMKREKSSFNKKSSNPKPPRGSSGPPLSKTRGAPMRKQP
jgi:hypothetical protein